MIPSFFMKKHTAIKVCALSLALACFQSVRAGKLGDFEKEATQSSNRGGGKDDRDDDDDDDDDNNNRDCLLPIVW